MYNDPSPIVQMGLILILFFLIIGIPAIWFSWLYDRRGKRIEQKKFDEWLLYCKDHGYSEEFARVQWKAKKTH